MKDFIKKLKTTESIFVVATMIITVMITLLAAYYKWGYKSAFALSVGMYLTLLLFAFITSNHFLQKLLFFGLIAGFVELIADKWLVENIQSLVYPAEEPKIWCSPNYMPFAWAVVLLHVGYLAQLIGHNKNIFIITLLGAAIGFGFIPLFEECAYYAEWWYYNPCKMFLHTPWYIMLGEGLICAVLPVVYSKISEISWTKTFFFGILEGLWIFVCYFIMYHILE
jgi:hypothetical protein